MRRKFFATLLMTTALITSGLTAFAGSLPSNPIDGNGGNYISGGIPEVGYQYPNGTTWDPSQHEITVRTVGSTPSVDVEFWVSLPNWIDLKKSGTSASGDYKVTVYGTVEDGTTITVKPSVTSLQMTATDGSGESVMATIAQSKTVWTAAEINGSTPVVETGTVSVSGLTASKNYEGKFYFDITQQ